MHADDVNEDDVNEDDHAADHDDDDYDDGEDDHHNVTLTWYTCAHAPPDLMEGDLLPSPNTKLDKHTPTDATVETYNSVITHNRPVPQNKINNPTFAGQSLNNVSGPGSPAVRQEAWHLLAQRPGCPEKRRTVNFVSKAQNLALVTFYSLLNCGNTWPKRLAVVWNRCMLSLAVV